MKRAPTQAPTIAGVDALLVTGIAAVLPVARELPVIITIAYLVFLAWRFGARFGWYQPSTWVRWLLTAVGVAVILQEFHTLLGRDAGVALLVWLTGLKMLELRSTRDAMLAAFLSILMLLGGFLYESTLLIGLYTLVVVTLVIGALVRLQQPTLAWHAMYRFAAALLLQALPIMIVAYLMFPRLPTPLWGVPVPEGQALTGIPETIVPGTITSLIPSNEIAFRAQFQSAPPLPRHHYWRVNVFWDTDGREWSSGKPVLARDNVQSLAETVPYQIIIEPSESRRIPALDMPIEAPSTLMQRPGLVYEHPVRRGDRRMYSFVSTTRYRTGELTAQERQRALALPPHVSERVRELALGWRQRHSNNGAVVQAALAHFREQPFFYTLAPPRLGHDPVDEFLFVTRRGFCEHYATSFVTLMRAAGIPSRVVAGYQGGVYNPTGNYIIVRQSDAHAWAEVWLENSGWTRVDPTAAVAPARIEYGIDGMQRLAAQALPLTELTNDAVRRVLEWGWAEGAYWRLRFAWDYANISWYYWVNDFRRDRQQQLLERLGVTNWSLAILIVVMLQLVLLYALFQRRARRPRDVVLRLYDTFCRKLKRIGLVRSVNEGPLDFAARVHKRRPDLASMTDEITQRYVALRYGNADARELGRLARAVHRFRPRRAGRA
jgi:protein-glutamine gamma-glutamyltransferase